MACCEVLSVLSPHVFGVSLQATVYLWEGVRLKFVSDECVHECVCAEVYVCMCFKVSVEWLFTNTPQKRPCSLAATPVFYSSTGMYDVRPRRQHSMLRIQLHFYSCWKENCLCLAPHMKSIDTREKMVAMFFIIDHCRCSELTLLHGWLSNNNTHFFARPLQVRVKLEHQGKDVEPFQWHCTRYPLCTHYEFISEAIITFIYGVVQVPKCCRYEKCSF